MRRTTPIGPAAALSIVLALGIAACDEAPTSPESAIPIESAEMTMDRDYPAQVKVFDGRGDNSGPIDVQGMILEFDPGTGDFRIYVRAWAHEPFIGDFRINVNLFNETAGSYFTNTFNDYSLSSPETELALIGSSPLLTGWSLGDVIHTNSLSGQPNPPGVTLYRTQVTSFPLGFLTNEDVVEEALSSGPTVVRSR